MKSIDIENKIIDAIENHKTILIKFKYGLGQELEIEFDPYIYGSDTMQYGFVWGFLPSSGLFYKLIFDFIISVRSTNKKFTVEPDTMYLYAIEEDHRIRVKEMDEPNLRVWARTAPVS
jgi:hypothetical protein